MAFQIKDFASITSSMVNHMRATQDKITDFHIGAVARTLVEAPAVEIDEFYQRVLHGLLEAIPVAVYKAFDFDQLPASTAGGFVRFSTDLPVLQPVPIPVGTVLQRPDTRLKFITVEEAEIPSDSNFVDVRVRAEWSGLDGNAPSGTITEMVGYIPQVTSVTNLDPLTGGKDAESPEERKARFIDYIGSLSRGTVWAVVYAARKSQVLDAGGVPIEYVSRVGVYEEAGYAEIYIYGSNGVPSEGLIAEAQGVIDGDYDAITHTWTPGYRPVGVHVQVTPMTEKVVNVALRIKMLDGYVGTQETINRIRDRLASQFFGINPGGVLYIEQIVEAALSVTGVERVLIENDANITCAAYEVLVLGDLDVEWWNGGG